MTERRSTPRPRTLLGAKIVFNSGRSAIDCTVRNLSAEGACLVVQSPLGIPDEFFLLTSDDEDLRACRIAWRSSDRIGVSFAGIRTEADASPAGDDAADAESLDAERHAFRAALDQVQFGIVLLDQELRAQFINRAFRRMFRLPDAKADSRPPFIALMYHSRDTRAYDIPSTDLDGYVAERVALVKEGDTKPVDIRLANGEVLRCQCAVLPSGGRMLCYTYVTDIVRTADELTVLRSALDRARDGIVLLDADLNAQFLNRTVRQLWDIPDEMAARRPNIAELVGTALHTNAYAIPQPELPGFIAQRVAQIRAGDPTPTDLHTGDGRIIRSLCDPLPTGGRMLTYCDVTDLIRNAQNLERLATIDATTGIFNRRHFLGLAEAEWARFQRYHRPLTMLAVDVDHLKTVNDRFGHAGGDVALKAVAEVLQDGRRASDIVARLGGDEFVVLLPETDSAQAAIVAERICAAVREQTISVGDRTFRLSLSIGVAVASLGMSGVAALLRVADEALYQAKTRGRDRCIVASPGDELAEAAQ